MAKILHIEDDPSSRLLVRKVLAAAGHHVVEAEGGLEGVRAAQVERPDLVLVDLNIPDLDGYEVALRLRGCAGLEGVPIVAITAEGDRETSLAVGCDGFVQKPIDAVAFPALIARFLGGHRELAGGGATLRVASQRIVERLEAKIEALQAANRQLEEMARIRREYMRNLSHELTTPMTPALGYLRLLLSEELGPLTPMQRKALLAVDAGASRFRGLLDTLLDVSALETGRMMFLPRDYDLAKVVKRALDEVRPRALDKQVELIVAPHERRLPAHGDSEKIRRAMAHLLDNAVKFTPAGGTVRASLRSDTASFAFIVEDSGEGIPPAARETVLQPFYQVDGGITRRHGGVGLGLAFAHRVAEAHQGRVIIGVSDLGGARVQLEFAVQAGIPDEAIEAP